MRVRGGGCGTSKVQVKVGLQGSKPEGGEQAALERLKPPHKSDAMPHEPATAGPDGGAQVALKRREVRLVRLGRGTHVAWMGADEQVPKPAQDDWAKYLANVQNGRGHYGDPDFLKRHGIAVGESFTWPSDLAETKELIDWSTLSISDDGPARQAAYALWRESMQGKQQTRTRSSQGKVQQTRSSRVASVHEFPSLPTQLSEDQEQLWTKYGGDEVEPLLSSGAVALVDAHWLVAFYESGGRALGQE